MVTRTRGRGAAHDQRRSEIVDAVLTVVADTGVPAVSIASVATSAGVSPGRVQHYFATKADLLEAAFDRVNAASSERIAAAVGGDLAAATPRQVLTVVLVELVPHDEMSWAHMHIRQSFTALALHHRSVAERLRAQYEQLHHHDLADLIRRDQQAGLISTTVTPQAAGMGLAALVEGLAYYVLIGVASPEAAREQVLNAISELYR